MCACRGVGWGGGGLFASLLISPCVPVGTLVGVGGGGGVGGLFASLLISPCVPVGRLGGGGGGGLFASLLISPCVPVGGGVEVDLHLS